MTQRRMRGERAQRLLDDPDLQAAFEAIESDIMRRMKNIELNGSELANAQAVELVRDLQANGRITRQLRQWVTSGQLDN